jgi:polysaccharide biosynthesis protein PslH
MKPIATKTPVVIIVGPAWPRCGTARVMQNQIEFYRNRGYFTLFICVPLHSSYTGTHPDWDDIKTGMQELGADQLFVATISNSRFLTAKYRAWIRHAFRGTALDWIVFTAESAELPEEAIRVILELPIALIHVNHVFTLGFARRLLRKTVHSRSHVPMILDTHDIQSRALEDRGEINPWTHRHDTLERLLRSEIAYLRTVKVLVHLSLDDFNFFKGCLPHAKHVLALPTIDESFVSNVSFASKPIVDPIDILFVGQSTTPNAAAVKWFFEKVWPLIADRGYGLKLVGPIDKLVRDEMPELYQAFRSHFVGRASELAPIYQAACCVIAPMVSGTGISIKTIEALALGKPFVGTSKAFRGMPMDIIVRAGLRAHDTPQDFADAIVFALSSGQSAAAASRLAYANLFSKEATFSSRDVAVKLAAAT